MIDYTKLTTGERIRTIRNCIIDSNGDTISQAVFAELIGVGQSAVGNWEAGRDRSLKAENLERIELKTKFRQEWILFGTGPMRIFETLARRKEDLDERSSHMREIVCSDIELELVIMMRGMPFENKERLLQFANFLTNGDILPALHLVDLQKIPLNPPDPLDPSPAPD